MSFNYHIFLKDLAESLRPALYIEFGTFEGETISALTRYCGRAIGVDQHFGKTPDGFEAYSMTTDEFCAKVLPELPPVNLAFIDADHASSQAFKDFQALLGHAAPGAIICLHDSYPSEESDTLPGYCHDSYKVPAMIQMHYPHLEQMTLPIFPGFTIVRNAPPGWVHWMVGSSP